MDIIKKAYKKITEQPTNKSYKPRNKGTSTIRDSKYESLDHRVERLNGKYMTFLTNESSAGLFGLIRKSMNTVSGTPLDQFVNAMCFRAESVNEGFLLLTKAGNFLAACSMIRLQLDSALICMAGLKAKNQHEFFLAFNSGTPINKIKDAEGNLLTQNYLAKSFEDEEIKAVFDNGNKFVHPSRLFQDESIDLTDGLKLLTYKEYSTPENIRKEAYKQMLIANNLLAKELHEWVKIKNGK